MANDERQPLRSVVQEQPQGNYAWVVEHQQALSLSRSRLLAILAERVKAKAEHVKPLLR